MSIRLHEVLEPIGIDCRNWIWPIGSVFTSVLPINPAVQIGFGTWVAFAEGRALVGHNAADPDFDTAEEVGGSKTVTLTTAQLPAHTHASRVRSSVPAGTVGVGGTTLASNVNATAGDSAATGGGQPHSNLQPYTVVYYWKRTL